MITQEQFEELGWEKAITDNPLLPSDEKHYYTIKGNEQWGLLYNLKEKTINVHNRFEEFIPSISYLSLVLGRLPIDRILDILKHQTESLKNYDRTRS